MIEHLAKIAGGANWRSVKLAAFTVYLDASGTEHDQPCLAVAGYVAPAESWVDFTPRWKKRLKKENLEVFHANEIERVIPDKGRRAALYIDLIEIISGTVARQFGCCIVNRSLAVIDPTTRKQWNMTAYSLAGHACASQVRYWFNSWKAKSLPEFIFECGDAGRGALTKRLEENGFEAPIFKPKTDQLKNGFVVEGAVPLQAADLLAFELFDPIRKIETDGHLLRIRPAYEALDRIPGTPRAISLREMEHLYQFSEMKDDAIWMPDSPEDIPIIGLSNPK